MFVTKGPGSPAYSLTCSTPVSEKLPHGHGDPLFALLDSILPASPPHVTCVLIILLFSQQGLHVSARFHLTRSAWSCESVTYLVWRVGRRISCGPLSYSWHAEVKKIKTRLVRAWFTLSCFASRLNYNRVKPFSSGIWIERNHISSPSSSSMD